MTSNIDALERLAKLRESGALSIAEFEQEKRKLLTAGSEETARSGRTLLIVGFIVVALAFLSYAFGNKKESSQEPERTPTVVPSTVSMQALPTFPATPTASSAPVNAPPTSPVPEMNPWAGTYKGIFEGDARGNLEISEGAKGRLKFALGIGSGGCAGGLEANMAVLSDTEGVVALPEDDSGNSCRISMVRRGTTITLTEEGCGYYHGFECSFSGTVKR
jgi:hypothetical protein